MGGAGHGEGRQRLVQQEKRNHQSARQGPGNKTTQTKALWHVGSSAWEAHALWTYYLYDICKITVNFRPVYNVTWGGRLELA